MLLSFGIQEIMKYLNFAAIVIGLFSCIDFLVRFKRPLNFKISFFALLLSLLALDYLLWIQYPFSEIVRLSPFINFGIWGAGLYTLSILTTGKIEKWVWISSGLIFILNLFNFYTLSQLPNIITSNEAVFSLRFKGNLSLLIVTRFLQRIIMIVSIFNLYITIKKNRLEHNIYQEKLIKWISVFISFVILSMVLNAVFNAFLPNLNMVYLAIIYHVFFIAVSITSIYRPTFLNNYNIGKFDLKKFSQVEDLKLTDANFYIPFFNNYYYLNKEANIEHFCKMNHIEERDSFNEQIIKLYNISFSNLINKHRIEYFIALSKNPSYSNFSIEALAKEAGFSSRTALYKPFKKFHGGTPIEFINSINN